MEEEKEDTLNIVEDKYFIDDSYMIRISYNNIDGLLNISTNEVMFYQFRYNSIIEAIQKLEHDICSNKKEIEIFNDLLGGLFST